MTQDDLRLIREAIFDPRAFTPRLDEVREIVRREVEAQIKATPFEPLLVRAATTAYAREVADRVFAKICTP